MNKSKSLPTQDKRRLYLSQYRKLSYVKQRRTLYICQYYYQFRKEPHVKKKRRLYRESAKEKVRQNA